MVLLGTSYFNLVDDVLLVFMSGQPMENLELPDLFLVVVLEGLDGDAVWFEAEALGFIGVLVIYLIDATCVQILTLGVVLDSQHLREHLLLVGLVGLVGLRDVHRGVASEAFDAFREGSLSASDFFNRQRSCALLPLLNLNFATLALALRLGDGQLEQLPLPLESLADDVGRDLFVNVLLEDSPGEAAEDGVD
eukprot:CAMPEP_0170511488 /NCGR_PEP_ID=MMETSP0208-20121228/66331_1 /TAXON_ID=197538 /ORGANISM="Strombidium inclinatum, Strain S3" /LENGTH=192 /DNA_ID=CAMNT_0010795037 /DNA_START=3317 /DNA_END=3892 /DNA_ORIENTATION=+